MPRKKLLLLPGFLFFIFSLLGNIGSPSTDALKLYNKANRLFSLSHPTAVTDSMAMVTFQQVITLAEKTHAVNESILFQCFFKKGILLEVGSNYALAKECYLKAIGIRKAVPNDSLAYKLYVYTGSVYYNLNNYDSANYFLLEAEKLSFHFPVLPEKERLYNALGALYYENGNYLQSRNYFSRALEIIKRRQPVDIASAINFENNIAVSCYKLGLYDEAITRYKRILHYGAFQNQIALNMGKALAAKGNYQEALAWFRKTDSTQIPGVLNEIAKTQLQLARNDSAQYYLSRFRSYSVRNSARVSSVDIGINHLYQSDVFSASGDFEFALESLQKAVIIFSGNFKNTDVFTNPASFTGLFASYRLFDALFKKAIAFDMLYKKSGSEKHLEAVDNTCNSVIALLRYIEKNYETDDAKIFLKQNSQSVYELALSVCLRLYQLHPGSEYLEKAFLTGEKNKGSIMAAGLHEKLLRKMPGMDGALFQKDRNIRYNIARLNIQLDQATDKHAIEVISAGKTHLEIELSLVQKQLEQNSYYYNLKYKDSYPAVKEIQAFLGREQAVISFYASTTGLHVFIITHTSLQYLYIDSLQSLQHNIEEWVLRLKQRQDGRKFKAGSLAASLYQQLIKPIQAIAGGKNQWIIIPDNILNLLPFESLPANNGPGILLETTEISYRVSSRFIVPRLPAERRPAKYSILAFAPFALKGVPVNYPEFKELNYLPSSMDEINGLPGKQYVDSAATKQNFLREITHYSILHLATHAISDINNTTGSFIAFYPGKKDQGEDCLYLEELYGLNMDSTELVVISACETGQGKLINTEGVISLSRGFLYAGCRGTINSLWSADDKATAAILKRFYYYLEKGFTKSKALQRAKLDYISSNALNKTPDYWSHLVLTGDAGPLMAKDNHFGNWWLLAGITAIVGITALVITVRRFKKEKKSRRVVIEH